MNTMDQSFNSSIEKPQQLTPQTLFSEAFLKLNELIPEGRTLTEIGFSQFFDGDSLDPGIPNVLLPNGFRLTTYSTNTSDLGAVDTQSFGENNPRLTIRKDDNDQYSVSISGENSETSLDKDLTQAFIDVMEQE
ncbi:MAG: hypothetical protein ACI83D_000338 [Planctomycetota bacterium]|jgi:hypothetical protein